MLKVRTILLLHASLLASAQVAPPPYTKTIVQHGTKVRVSLDRVEASGKPREPLRESENVVVRFQVEDNATGNPLSGSAPAAWFDRKTDGAATTAEQCTGKIKRFAEGSSFSRTELDLTSYYVVIMNADASLTVVNPRFGYGDTRLLAMIALDAAGEDWALTADGRKLLVSIPKANEVVAVDTGSWKISGKASSIASAGRMALQPDEAYAWVAYSGEGEESGVAAISLRDLKVAARIRTGRGYHHLAFTADSSFAFVTNPLDGTVSVIDIRKLEKTTDVSVGDKPTWMAYSDLSKAVYVSNEGDGYIVAIDAASQRVRARILAAPGLGQIRFAPGGRFALAVNPSTDRIYVVDASSDRIVQQGKLDKGPNQIAFTNKQAHIRHQGSDAVLMISLESLGIPGAEISVADFSGGRHSPGAMSRSVPADGIVQASGENGVLVANPGDKSVYFYMEGMAAPMGNFSNYRHEPVAVLSVDRELRERGPGTYETTVALPRPGSYDIALFLDQPRIVSCFDFTVMPQMDRGRPQVRSIHVQPRLAPVSRIGVPARMQFRLTFTDTGAPALDLRDIVILIAGSSWQRRQVASQDGDGVYHADFTAPDPGIYSVFLSSQSAGLAYLRYATVEIQGTVR